MVLWKVIIFVFVWSFKQDDLLAPAVFLQEYKYFDQHLPQLKTRLLSKIQFWEIFYKHHFHKWFLYLMQKKGITTFRSKILVSQYRKISLGNASAYQKISAIEKINASENGGVSRFFVKTFSSHSTKKFR